jgi:hypothetical protein
VRMFETTRGARLTLLDDDLRTLTGVAGPRE